MIKVNKDFNNPPPALVNGFLQHKQSLQNKKSDHSFDARIYNTAIKPDLLLLYHQKCAYCETYLPDEDFTIEHYRPKKGANSYYWLGYEWSNLFPVCKKCNNKKDDYFPINVPERVSDSTQIARIRTPQTLPNGDWDTNAMKANHPYLLQEQPLLLHPEIDNPAHFLRLLPTGILQPILQNRENNAYKRGKETLNLLPLNRDELVYRRRKIIETIVDKLRSQTVLFLKIVTAIPTIPQGLFDNLIALAFFALFDEMKKNANPIEEYAMVNINLWNNIEELIFGEIHKGNTKMEALLKYAHKLYLAPSHRVTV